ncbi:MAG: Lrp/AsnC family transcriptional regulator [Candidatus Bathyarchaeia archaeon]
MSDVTEGKEELDDIDLKILHLLQENAFVSYEEVGTNVGLAESTIRYRVKKLQELGVILGFTCAIDLKKLGYNLMVFANIDVQSGKERLATQKLTRIPNIVGLFAVSGSSDLVSIIVARNNDELAQIAEEIRSFKEITKMSLSVVFRTYKWECTTKLPLKG